jgi:hypothetical protein
MLSTPAFPALIQKMTNPVSARPKYTPPSRHVNKLETIKEIDIPPTKKVPKDESKNVLVVG